MLNAIQDSVIVNEFIHGSQKVLDEITRKFMLPKELISESGSSSYSSALLHDMQFSLAMARKLT